MPRPSAKASTASRWGIHPGVEHVANGLRKLEERTGLTIDQWIARIRREGPPTERERRDWLKTTHGMGTNYAWWLAELAEGKSSETLDAQAYLAAAEGYVETMFAGKKGHLVPIRDALLGLGWKLGADVKICPCQTIIPFYRNHVFAEIKPTTNTRVDLGLALGDTAVEGRLIDTGGLAKKNRITHRIPLESVKDIDAEVKRWLKVAYQRDA